jgi:uncharacterized membrane protein YeaQ/YmgE (transglycosylase-associated protein family)
MSILLAVIFWIIIGGLAGWIASSIMGVREGFWGDVLIGIVGAVLGGLIFTAFGIGGTGIWWSLLTAVVGAVILLGILRLVRRPVAGRAM